MRRRKLWARIALVGCASALALTTSARSAEPALSPRIAPLGFLVGAWTGDTGRAEGGHVARGTFTIESAAGGRALLRRDHTEVLGTKGQVAQTFDQIMLVYPDGEHLHTDYFDGAHAIHYLDAIITPGERVRFEMPETPSAPAFRLTYSRLPPDRVSILFEMRAPGETTYRTVAEGAAHRDARTR